MGMNSWVAYRSSLGENGVGMNCPDAFCLFLSLSQLYSLAQGYPEAGPHPAPLVQREQDILGSLQHSDGLLPRPVLPSRVGAPWACSVLLLEKPVCNCSLSQTLQACTGHQPSIFSFPRWVLEMES